VTASRTFEGWTIGGQDSFIDAIAGMTTGTLNLDHQPTFPAPFQNTIRGEGAQLLAAGD
jgi:hypothetical protein